MKKSSLFVIAVVCVLAIVIITFFGQAVEMGQFSNPIKTITVTNATNDLIRQDYDYNAEGGDTKIWLHVSTAPADADDPSAYRFMIDDRPNATVPDGAGVDDIPSGESVVIEEHTGCMHFFEPAYVSVRIVATDGGGAYKKVAVYCEAAREN